MSKAATWRVGEGRLRGWSGDLHLVHVVQHGFRSFRPSVHTSSSPLCLNWSTDITMFLSRGSFFGASTNSLNFVLSHRVMGLG